MDKITVKNLDLYYGDFKALKTVNMNIAPNEVTAFIGPSGCGKVHLAQVPQPHERPGGGLQNHRRNPSGRGGHLRQHRRQPAAQAVEHGVQKPNPFPMSVYDNIAYGPRTHGIRSKVKLDEIVEKSLRGAAIWDELKDRLKKSALGLSGGQQQRLCIARALAVEPEVLLMDEPTSALDPISTSKIEDLAMELKSDYTIVIVTHNMQQAARISDKTAFFLLGELVEFGPTEQVFSMPKDKRTEDYITGRFG
ncbi:MAG: phosphate ABC transporter ATP-binding protein [Acutalibacter sp.]